MKKILLSLIFVVPFLIGCVDENLIKDRDKQCDEKCKAHNSEFFKGICEDIKYFDSRINKYILRCTCWSNNGFSYVYFPYEVKVEKK